MDGKPIRIIIDGTEYEGQEGATVLDILNEHGIEHPQICHVPEVDPIQTCDTCLIEADGKLKRACSLKAENGMSVSLSTERVKKRRRKRWIVSSQTICFTVRFAIIITATASCIIRRK